MDQICLLHILIHFSLLLYLLLENFHIISENLIEIGTQIPHSAFTRRKKFLEVKQEEGARKASKFSSKKRGHLRK